VKVSCLQENLNKGLSIVGRAVATRTTLPITQNILIATDDSRLKLVATNLEMAISCWVGAKVEEKGTITIPARILTEFVSSLPSDNVELVLAKNTLTLKSGRFEARINGVPSDDFPPIPQIADGLATKVEADALKQGINQVSFAAANEESRPVLTGVHADFNEDKLTLAAADGFRLAVHKTALLVKASKQTAIIIPAKALNELARFLAEQKDPVEITVNQQKTQALFKLKDIEMVSQLIQGAFPNYSQLIPQSYTTRTIIDVTEFLRAARMSSIFARDGSGIVRIMVTPGVEAAPGKVSVSARAEEVGDNVGELDAMVDGEKAQIAFNVKYLADALNAIHQKQVALETTTSSSPGVIRPVGVDNYVHVVMPMFVQW
jgi:DNA polymerase-3 subunit beta